MREALLPLQARGEAGTSESAVVAELGEDLAGSLEVEIPTLQVDEQASAPEKTVEQEERPASRGSRQRRARACRTSGLCHPGCGMGGEPRGSRIPADPHCVIFMTSWIVWWKVNLCRFVWPTMAIRQLLRMTSRRRFAEIYKNDSGIPVMAIYSLLAETCPTAIEMSIGRSLRAGRSRQSPAESGKMGCLGMGG